MAAITSTGDGPRGSYIGCSSLVGVRNHLVSNPDPRSCLSPWWMTGRQAERSRRAGCPHPTRFVPVEDVVEVCPSATSSDECISTARARATGEATDKVADHHDHTPRNCDKGDVAPMKRIIMTMALVLGCSICSQSFGFDLLDRMLGVKGCGSASSCCDTGCDAPSCCEPACGCEASGCCAEPACGCEAPACCESNACCAEPACGCEAPACGAPSCCEPACGCEVSSCDSCCDPCGRKSCGGLLSKLFAKKSRCGGCDSCCEPACGCEAPACGCGDSSCCEPACGCEAPSCCEPACGCEVSSCDSCCDPCAKRGCGGLLAKLFGGCNKGCCDSGCDSCCEPACGCESSCCEPACGCEAPACGCAAPAAAPAMEAAPMPPAPVVDPSASLNAKRRVIQASAVYVR